MASTELTFAHTYDIAGLCSWPFALALIRTNFVKYVSVIFVLQIGSLRTQLLLKK